MTAGAGHPKPTLNALQDAMAAYHEEHGEKHGLEPPPTPSSVRNHLLANRHSARWSGWDDKAQG